MSGMTPLEGEVMDRYEAGGDPLQIALDLRMSRARVKSIIGTFRIDHSENRRGDQAMRLGSQMLLAALRREGLA